MPNQTLDLPGEANPDGNLGPSPRPFQALQSHCSALLSHVSASLSDHPAASHLQSAIGSLGSQAKDALRAAVSRLAPVPAHAQAAPLSMAHRSEPAAAHRFDLAMKVEDMEDRLAGIPVYALSNSDEEFMLVSGVKTGKSLGLLCFKKEDAEALLDQMKCLNPGMRQGSKVVPVALNKVFQLKVNGVGFRFIPDPHQIVNAIKVIEQLDDSVDGFPGVPVFQSRSLVLRSQNKRYRPVFFRKEDLEESLYRASKQQNYLNPALRKGDIQVSALEEMISEMRASSASKWDDVVFVPPGFDISAHLGQQQKPVATG